MDPNMALLIMVVFLLALAAISFRASVGLARRSICNVVSRFRDQLALRYENAATLEDLGLANRPLITLGLRDYKPYAFQLLVQREVIQPTPDGRFFLDERNLDRIQGVSCLSR